MSAPILHTILTFDFDHASAKIQSILAFFAACSTVCSFLSNCWPDDEKLAKHPRLRAAYLGMIKVTSAVALNFRRRLPSWDLPLFGFHHHCTACQAAADAAEKKDQEKNG